MEVKGVVSAWLALNPVPLLSSYIPWGTTSLYLSFLICKVLPRLNVGLNVVYSSIREVSGSTQMSKA